MPRFRQPEPQPAPEPPLPPPLDATDPERVSLDATDWRMYCDRLQDADAPEDEWRRAGRIAASLAVNANLVLIAYCTAEHLENHYLRVGANWFIGADGTYLESYSLLWWRPTWVRAGFKRYPTTSKARRPKKLIALNTGTPWSMPHPRFEVVRQHKQYANLILAFFDAHALVEIPQEYL